MILAGDLGGTKTHLALFAPGGSPRAPAAESKLASGDFPTFAALLDTFLERHPGRITRAVFGIAGPVVDNRSETTNLPWVLDADEIGARVGGAQVTLLNDLETTGWGLELLGEGDLLTLSPGRPATGNRALIAAGTGLGEGILFWDGQRHVPSASEGGHADFGPRDPLEDDLNAWLRARHGRTSYERVLSGQGLADLYRFLTDQGHGHAPEAFAARFAAALDPAAEVTAAAESGACERASLALARFVSIYGAEAGNLALKALAVNGVFVGGGIAPRIVRALTSGAFLESFLAKGRLRPVLEPIPVHVILDARTALWGAAAYALGGASALRRRGAVASPI